MLARGTPVNESVTLISEGISISRPVDFESPNHDNRGMRERCGDVANYRRVMLDGRPEDNESTNHDN